MVTAQTVVHSSSKPPAAPRLLDVKGSCGGTILFRPTHPGHVNAKTMSLMIHPNSSLLKLLVTPPPLTDDSPHLPPLVRACTSPNTHTCLGT